MNLKAEILRELRDGDMLTKLLLINGLLFMSLWVIEIISAIAHLHIYSWTIQNISVSNSLFLLVRKPWTILTYMFFETSFLSLITNMLILFWMGKLLMDFLNEKVLLATYILGGFSGVLLPVIMSSSGNVSINLLGSNAAVLAVTTAVCCYAPNYRIYLLLFKEVSLKTIGLIIVVIEFLPFLRLVHSMDLSVAFIPLNHLGGILYGFCWATLYKNGTDISSWFIQLCERLKDLFTPKPVIRVSKRAKKDESYVTYEEVTTNNTNQEEIDKILDKIAKSGYDSLTSEEKQKLFKQGK
ncbi:MAG: rhomboid family intramembrane serine protease [Bacteroidales bacterium]|nr:rhomboid family intramembrane serine protease [Bacteroidales bacterium]